MRMRILQPDAICINTRVPARSPFSVAGPCRWPTPGSAGGASKPGVRGPGPIRQRTEMARFYGNIEGGRRPVLRSGLLRRRSILLRRSPKSPRASILHAFFQTGPATANQTCRLPWKACARWFFLPPAAAFPSLAPPPQPPFPGRSRLQRLSCGVRRRRFCVRCPAACRSVRPTAGHATPSAGLPNCRSIAAAGGTENRPGPARPTTPCAMPPRGRTIAILPRPEYPAVDTDSIKTDYQ